MENQYIYSSNVIIFYNIQIIIHLHLFYFRWKYCAVYSLHLFCWYYCKFDFIIMLHVCKDKNV